MEEIPVPTGDRGARRRVEGGPPADGRLDEHDSGFRSGGGEWRNDERARIRETRKFCKLFV